MGTKSKVGEKHNLYKELEEIGLTKNQSDKVMAFVDTLPIHIKNLYYVQATISKGIITVEPCKGISERFIMKQTK